MKFFDCLIAQYLSLGLIALGVIVFIVLLFIPAWYGRYGETLKIDIRKYLGSLNPRVAWCIQEMPSFLLPLLGIILNFSRVSTNYVNLVLLLMFMAHYFNRYVIHIQNNSVILSEF